jgi:hypothetical protein
MPRVFMESLGISSVVVLTEQHNDDEGGLDLCRYCGYAPLFPSPAKASN